MKVSIITPLFNRAHFLEQTADSVLAQTHTDWEWIVVDDGSDDDGPNMMLAWAKGDSRIQFYRRSRGPKGACTCRNIGAEHASGEFIIFLDSDDLLAPHCLQERIYNQAFRSNNPLHVFYFPTVIFNESQQHGRLWDDVDHPEEWVTSLLRLNPPCQSTGPFWPRNLWHEKLGWRENLHVWQDVELHLRSHFNGIRFQAAKGSKPDLFHRVAPDSISRTDYHADEKVESRILVLKYALHQLSKEGMTQKRRQALGAMGFSLFRALCRQRKFKTAKILKNDLSRLWPESLRLAAWEVLACSGMRLDRFRILQQRWNSVAHNTYPTSTRQLGRIEWFKSST